MTPEGWGAAQLFLMFPSASFLVSEDAPAYGLKLLSAWSSLSSPEGSQEHWMLSQEGSSGHWLPTDLRNYSPGLCLFFDDVKILATPLEAVHDPAQHSWLLHCLKRAFHQLRINASELSTAASSEPSDNFRTLPCAELSRVPSRLKAPGSQALGLFPQCTASHL